MSKKLSEELRHCLEDDSCGNCQYRKPEIKFTCRGLLQKAYEKIKEYEEWRIGKMERLTERLSNGQAAVFGCGNNCEYDYKYCNNHLEDCPTINKIYEKLAEYEDLEEQGKLLNLPCAVGDTVYVLAECEHIPEQLDGTLWDENGAHGTATGYY